LDRGPGIEFHQIFCRSRDLTQRRGRPGDTHGYGIGGGTFSPFANLRSHSRTTS
jgi:hypothetical protein